MNIQGLALGTRLVTASGDIVELLEILDGALSARVRFIEIMGSDAEVNEEQTLTSDDFATLDGARFVGPT